MQLLCISLAISGWHQQEARLTCRTGLHPPAPGFGQRRADNGNDIAQVFAGGEFRDDAAVFAMNFDLGGDDAGEHAFATSDDRGRGFIAGRFDP